MVKTNVLVFLKLTLIVISLYDAEAVNVDLSGRLQMGKEVARALRVILRPDHPVRSGRRSIGPDLNRQNSTALTVKAALLCKDISFCNKKLQNFIEEYLTKLSQSVEILFASTMTPKLDQDQTKQGVEPDAAFEDELRVTFHDMKHQMVYANVQYEKDKDMAFTWLNVLKQISAKVQEVALGFFNKRLDGPTEKAKEILKRKIITSTLQTEVQYEDKLCREHDLCTKFYECSRALHTIVETLLGLTEDKIKEFMKMFYQTLSDTKLYSILDEVTTNEFQYVLTDMAFSNSVPVKDVLASVLHAVEARQRMQQKSTNKKAQSQDALLFVTILSDMDHFYSKGRRDPFRKLLKNFKSWATDGGDLKSYLKEVMAEISDELSKKPEELLTKLKNGVRTFLEITVEPESV